MDIKMNEVREAIDRLSVSFKAAAVRVANETGSTTGEELDVVLPQSLRDLALVISAAETLLDFITEVEKNE